MKDGRPRFYVIATTGYSLVVGSQPEMTSYAVLDRCFAYREVFTAYAKRFCLPDAVRRAQAEAHAERANQRYEEWLAAL